MSRVLFAVLLAGGLLSSPWSTCRADDKPADDGQVVVSYVGQTVFLKNWGTHFGITKDNGEFDDFGVLSGPYYTVLAETGHLIQVSFKGKEGWFAKNEAVLAADAVKFFTSRLTINPKDILALQKRGHAWQLRGNLDNALMDFEDATSINPRSTGLWINHATVCSLKKDYDKAIADYTRVIRLDPNSVYAFHHRALAWEAKNEYDKAIQDHTEVIRLLPIRRRLLQSRQYVGAQT